MKPSYFINLMFSFFIIIRIKQASSRESDLNLISELFDLLSPKLQENVIKLSTFTQSVNKNNREKRSSVGKYKSKFNLNFIKITL